jgi:outer membrane immunogenic protein
MRSTILTAAAFLMWIGGAQAADMPLKAAPVAPPPPTWTGFYIGINGGGAWGTVNTHTVDAGPDSFFAGGNVPAVVAGASQSFNTSGGLAGGQIGYLFQGGQTILGVEASFDWTSLNGTASNGPTVYPVTPPSTFSWNLNAKTEWIAMLTARAGVDMGWWYPYLTGGGAVTDIKYNTTYIDTFYPSVSVNNFSKTALGWVAGAGAEARFWEHWLVRAEYLHMDFQNVGGLGTIACTRGVGNCVGAGFSTRFMFNTHMTEDVVRAALSYKF